MAHIEFVGPPGSGKSTIHERLLHHENLYGGVAEDAFLRRFLDTADLKYRVMYRAMPSSIGSFFRSQFLKYRYLDEALITFIRRNPDVGQHLANGVSMVQENPGELIHYLKRVIERFQLGIMTVRDEEQLFLDEGFTQTAFSILARQPTEEFPLDDFLDTVPTPKILIHIDAPADVCVTRQKQRGRIASTAGGDPAGHPDHQEDRRSLDPLGDGDDSNEYEAQERCREICTQIADKQRTRTAVVTVDNTDTIEKSVSQVLMSLNFRDEQGLH